MSKRKTYREQLDAARQAAAVAALKEAGRLAAEGDFTGARKLTHEALDQIEPLDQPAPIRFAYTPPTHAAQPVPLSELYARQVTTDELDAKEPT